MSGGSTAVTPDPGVTTTYEDAVRLFVGRSARADGLLESWRLDPRRALVVPFVQGHITSTIYRQTPDDIERICVNTAHAIGQVDGRIAEAVWSIRDWHPAFAFMHVLHYMTEKSGRVPTYQAFQQFCSTDTQAAAMLTGPARAAVEAAVGEGYPRRQALDAMKWRVGNVYYSFLRELYVIAVLRQSGLDARYHLLADALFRVDCWIADHVISLYVGNTRFKEGDGGRKPRPDLILSDAVPPFNFIEIQLTTQRVFGSVHLPSRERILVAAREEMGE